jgi:hypothetical protein
MNNDPLGGADDGDFGSPYEFEAPF